MYVVLINAVYLQSNTSRQIYYYPPLYMQAFVLHWQHVRLFIVFQKRSKFTLKAPMLFAVNNINVICSFKNSLHYWN